MNCARCRRLLAAYLEGLLEGPTRRSVEEHLSVCDACRMERQDLAAVQQSLTCDGATPSWANIEEGVLNRIIREQNARLKSAAQVGTGLRVRRLIMKSSLVKIAAAAVVVLVALGAWSLWSGTQSGVALADVLAKVEQVRAFMYKMTMHMKGSMQGLPLEGVDMEGTMLIANEYGMKMDMSSADPALDQAVTQQVYVLPKQKMILVLTPSAKRYMRIQADDEMLEEKREENNDPRLLLKKVLECQYTDLGRTILDGVEVQGFQTTDPAYDGGMGGTDVTVWVDRKTELPIRVDLKVTVNEQMEVEATLHDFLWDVPVSAAEFDPVIPADFAAGPGDGIRMPAMTEETALEGLKLFVSLRDKYPKDLNIITLIHDSMEGLKDSFVPDASSLHDPESANRTPEERQKELMDDAEEHAKEVVNKIMPIQSLGGFYMKLVQEKMEPVYYGSVVTPGDKALVLLRWKTGENEYRVIFGDLHAETVDAATLATLETALPK